MKFALSFLMIVLSALPALGSDRVKAASTSASDRNAVQDLIFLGDNRPVFLRLRITTGGKPFRIAWLDSIRSLHTFLDRDGSGTLTKEEADKGSLSTIVRLATAGATTMPRTELDNHPKDGVVSMEELTDALRTALGPFRVEIGKVASGKTDALFEQLDGDKDGSLTNLELASASHSLQKLDLDDDELIDVAELEPFSNPAAMQMENMTGRRARLAPVPAIIELTPDDATLRPVRLLIKRYDKGTAAGAPANDNKLALSEFSINAKAFADADADADGSLDTDELRRFLSRVTPDLELKVLLSADAAGPATVEVVGSGGSAKDIPADVKVKQLAGGDVEIAVEEIRLEVHVDDGVQAAAVAKQSFMNQFQADDADNNGYLEKTELMKDKNHPSPLASLFDLLDRDGDGKLYPKEIDSFVDRQAEAARNRLVLSTSDQGRAIFAILDLNRDRRLGLREIRSTVARVSSWDRNRDGRITADEIPHHYQLTLGRGQVSGINNPSVANIPGTIPMPPTPVGSGPRWFRKMDRNQDGDISRREFHGPRDQFNRFDRDKDDLIDPAEAAAVSTTATTARGN